MNSSLDSTRRSELAWHLAECRPDTGTFSRPSRIVTGYQVVSSRGRERVDDPVARADYAQGQTVLEIGSATCDATTTTWQRVISRHRPSVAHAD